MHDAPTDEKSIPTPEPAYEDQEIRSLRRCLMHRSAYMGIKELDVIFGSFARKYLAELPPNMLRLYAQLLEEDDRSLYDYVMGRSPFPPHYGELFVQHLHKTIAML